MICQVNDTVLYSAGLCKIAEITNKEIGGQHADYYVLKPLYDEKTSIYIPVDNERATTKLRRILSAEEIRTLIKTMPGEDTIWIENDAVRHDRYREIIAHGDRAELVQLIKTLYQRQQERQAQGKKLHVVDERFMKSAEKILYEEFAHVLKLELTQVLPFIVEQIEVEAK
ncbi:MAG: CarD family transcriptional regulator [Christensenellaceae bacterium]|jgi:CarD family transcriptional regulator|nr:CarD family transcriptional regulator [Christensenellaceae bacterium]